MTKQYTYFFILLFASMLIGCRANSVDLPDLATQSDNRIVVYSSFPSDRIDDYLAGFSAENPTITVELVVDTAAALTERLISADQKRRPDVIWGLPVSNALQLEWLNLLKPYAPANLEQIDRRFYDTNRPPHWVGTAARVLVFCVNTDLAAERQLPIPLTWQELVDPIYQGQIIVPSPTTSGSGFLVLGTILDIYGETDGWDYLTMLDAQVVEYAEDVKIACELAAQGHVPIAVSFDYRTVERQEAGDPIEIIYPADGAGWDMEVTGLVRKDKVSAAATTFVDWASSSAALQLYGEDRQILSGNDSPKSTDNQPDDDTFQSLHELLLDADLPRMSANRERIVREWAERFADGIVILSE